MVKIAKSQGFLMRRVRWIEVPKEAESIVMGQYFQFADAKKPYSLSKSCCNGRINCSLISTQGTLYCSYLNLSSALVGNRRYKVMISVTAVSDYSEKTHVAFRILGKRTLKTARLSGKDSQRWIQAKF